MDIVAISGYCLNHTNIAYVGTKLSEELKIWDGVCQTEF